MRILIACEFSQTVAKQFYDKGHEVWSCDLLPGEKGLPHIQDDVLKHLGECRANNFKGWELIIAHPPCTHLAVSGAKHFAEKRADGRQREAVEFFMKIAEAPCERIAIENPVGIMSSQWRKPDQIIQPYMFGDPFTKTTCLWLKGLPLLKPTDVVDKGERHITKGGKSLPVWYNMPPGLDRAKIRSTTFEGMAKAMASQWSEIKETQLTLL